MDRKYTPVLNALAAFIAIYSVSANDSLTHDEVLRQIVEKARQNEELANEIGFHQVTAIKKLNDGKVSSENVRMHRLTWVDNKPYLELLKVNGQEPDAKEKKEETERKARFIQSLRKKSKDDPDNVTWYEMYSKYDFQAMPSDSIGYYVFSFKPKAGRLPERSRTEKVLNHVAGKLWADEKFNIVRAEAQLLENVRFGLGILGNIEKLEMKFEQQDFEQIRVPSYFYVHFKARVALVKTEERKIESTYKDFFRRPTNATNTSGQK